MKRRAFLNSAGLLAAAAFASSGKSRAQAVPARPGPRVSAKELAADLVIVGSGVGGCAAALAAARNGLRVIMTEETEWIGGQLTSQAVPPDENAHVETHGATKSYQAFRQRVRDYYARNFPLTDAARANRLLNPGNGSVSKLCHEPRVALAVLEEMLAPFVAGKRVEILRRHVPLSADTTGDRVNAVRVRSVESGAELVLRAPYFIDATETGDLLPLTRTEYVIGSESQRETGEPHATAEANPRNHQAFTCCFAVDYLEGEDHVIEKPAEYGFWREHVPPLTPPWSGKLLSLYYSQPKTLKPFAMGFDPAKGTGLFKYRRLIDRANFAPGTYAGDITLINWPQNDYMLGNIVDVPAEEAARHVARAKQLSLSLLYWLQTECPRADGGTGWKGLRLRPDIVGTGDGLAKYPYIRESRRIKAELTVTELQVATEARKKIAAAGRVAAAEKFPDSVGIGHYAIDLHPSSGATTTSISPRCRFRFLSAPCCRVASKICCRRARTSARRISRTGVIASILSSGTSARPRAPSRLSAWRTNMCLARCAIPPRCWPIFKRSSGLRACGSNGRRRDFPAAQHSIVGVVAAIALTKKAAPALGAAFV